MCIYARSLQEFPSRKYAYAKGEAAGLSGAPEKSLSAGQAFRFIAGRDLEPILIGKDEGRKILHDPFAQLVLFNQQPLPTSLRSLLTVLDMFNSDAAGLPEQRSFVVADGGQIPWTPETDGLQRDFRFVVARARANTSLPDLLISCSTNVDSDVAFLQVIGWDPVLRAYQFYDRRDGAWVWAGSSWDALVADSRGKGPFDSHVNGALNMKELKQPWINWHSQAANILDNVLAPSDVLKNEPLWTNRKAAQDFETDVARPGISRWTDARFDILVKNGELQRLPDFMRQLLETTTVNLVSSSTAYDSLPSVDSVPLPLTFFLASDALIDACELEPQITVPRVPSDIYRAMLKRYEVSIGDGKFKFPVDTHFVFVVPEPALEDLLVLRKLLSFEMLSPKFAASMLMIDFANPVFSPRRARLTQYVPDSARIHDLVDFAGRFVFAIQASPSASSAGSPEYEFLANWNLPERDWRQEFQRRVERFFTIISNQLRTPEGFAPIFELAESRRREFRKRPLAEFRLTTPITNIPENAPLLEFSMDGQVRQK